MRALIEELRPPTLEEGGLAAALKSFGARLGASWGIEVEVQTHEEGRLPPAEEVELYRIACEALTNASKHSQARKVLVELQVSPPHFGLTVANDGVGFDPAAPSRPDAFGLRGMLERASALGARLVIHSQPGKGTRVEVTRNE